MAILVAILTILFAYSSVKPITNTPIAYAEEILSCKSNYERTLTSEINRLSIKYKVSSTTATNIIKCESSMYGKAINENIDKDGNVWSRDYGPMQVNDYYHKETMQKLGLDIYNQWDSLEYGFMLLAKNGTSDWNASRSCWSKLK